MKILLVRPRQSDDTIGLQHVMLVEPLELEVLAALVEPADDVRIIDMILEEDPIDYFIRDYKPDVLGVTGYITNLPRMKEYCRIGKQWHPNIITIAGGVHVERFPGDIDDPAIDFRVVRNATVTFPRLLKHISGSGPKPAGVLGSGEILDPQSLPDYDFYYPRPRRDLTAKYRRRYFYVFHDRVALMKTSFGCPYTCNFCYCRKITGDRYHVRTLTDILEELESINEREIYIVDDDFLVSRGRIAMFIEMLRERKLDKKFLVYGRADFIINNPDIIAQFKKVGLRTIIVGLESFSDEELSGFNKQVNASANEQAMKILKSCKVDCYAAVILSPTWSVRHFKMLTRKLLQLGIKFVNLQPLTPLPGIDFQVEDGQLVIDRKDFPKWDLAHVALRPEKMSVAEFYAQMIKCYGKIIMKPRHLLSHIKYSPGMQLKVIRGAYRVLRQYRGRYREALERV